MCWIQELEKLEIVLEINILILAAVVLWTFLLQVRGTQIKLPKANEERTYGDIRISPSQNWRACWKLRSRPRVSETRATEDWMTLFPPQSPAVFSTSLWVSAPFSQVYLHAGMWPPAVLESRPKGESSGSSPPWWQVVWRGYGWPSWGGLSGSWHRGRVGAVVDRPSGAPGDGSNDF